MKSIISATLLTVATVISTTGQAAVLYNTPAATYTQNFDSLPNSPENVSLGASPVGWKDDDPAPPAGNFSIPGWYLRHSTTQTEGGFSGQQRMRIGAGTANTGAFMSFGASGTGERALGVVGSSTLQGSQGSIYYAARFTNNTGIPLTEFTLSYTAEQWRDGGATGGSAMQAVDFAYKVGAATINELGYDNVAALGFVSPVFGAVTGVALNGNDPANQVAVGPFTVSGLNWQPGEDLWIRWSDVDHPGNDHGLAIDNLNFSAIPEPASLALSIFGFAAACLARRRR